MAQRKRAVKTTKPNAKTKSTPKAATKSAAKAKPVAKKPTARKPAAKKPVAKKPTARKPAAKKPVAKKPATRKPAAKKPVAKKPATRKPRAKRSVAKTAEVSKNPEDYPVTPVVAAYRDMVQRAIDRRKSDLPDKPTKTQLLYISSLEQNWKDAPYVLRNSSSRKYELHFPHIDAAKKAEKRTKRKTTRKKTTRKKR